MALSCERHTAYVYDRGGKRQILALDPLSKVRWERVRDTMSSATATVAAPSEECRRDLGLVEAGRHELVLFRGSRRVWEGPITRITYEGNSVSMEAKDVMHYVNRTIMRNEYDNRYPNNGKVLDRVKRIFKAELARKEALDPPINLLQHVQYLYAGDDTYFPTRFYDTITLVRQIRAASSTPEINALLNPMQSVYGIKIDFGVGAPSYGEYGVHWKVPTMADGRLKESVVAGVEALAKYPPEFIRPLKLNGFEFVKDLDQTANPGWDLGGVAVDGFLFIDIQNQSMVSATIHHELNHLIRNAFPDTMGALSGKWLAANPPGFTYSGNGYQSPAFTGEHPVGFTRDYGRFSWTEDLAEIAGMVFSTEDQAVLARYMAGDQYITKKVALFKEWMAQISGGLIAGETFYKAIHSKPITVVGESGVKDAGTAAHTLPYEMTVFEHVDSYAQRGGMDYTVVGRSVLFFDVRRKIGQTPMVTETDFLGDPIITQYGMELSTIVAHTDGKGHYGIAGGVDPYYGEWETLYQAYDEDAERDGDEPPSVAELKSQAMRTWDQARLPPLVVRIPDNTSLNPNGVLKVEDLVPGVHIPLTAKLPGRTLSQMQKLDSMTVSEDSATGELIKVVLSPAPSSTYMEEDE